MKLFTSASRAALAALLLLVTSTGTAWAQEATIRKNLRDRIPAFSQIDEVRKTPMDGLYEIRVNDSDIFYTDAEGNFVIQGVLLDTRGRRNLTQERTEKLSAIDFNALPLKDAFTVVRGTGKRKMAVFEDPNCGYCKQFERDMQKVDNVTVYMFLYPILNADSLEKSKHIWCAKDKAKAWQDLMVRDQQVAPGNCDTAALQRNIAFGHKYKITGTPTLVFTDGGRVPGAVSAVQVEKYLASAK